MQKTRLCLINAFEIKKREFAVCRCGSWAKVLFEGGRPSGIAIAMVIKRPEAQGYKFAFLNQRVFVRHSLVLVKKLSLNPIFLLLAEYHFLHSINCVAKGQLPASHLSISYL